MPLLFGLDNVNGDSLAPSQPAHFLSNLSSNITSRLLADQPQSSSLPVSRIAMPGQTSIGPSSNTAPTPNLSTLSGRLSAPIETLPWYMRPGRAASDAISSTRNDVLNRFTSLSDSLSGIQQNPDGSFENSTLTGRQQNVDRVSKFANVGLGIINTAFLPLTSVLKGAEQLPLLGDVFKVVNDGFGKVGDLGSHIGNHVVDKLPVSDQTKESVRSPVSEMFSLLSQIALGKVVAEATKPRLSGLTQDIYSKIIDDPGIKKKLEVQSTTGETPLKVNIPTKPNPVQIIHDAYSNIAPDKINEAVGNILTEGELSHAGYRYMNESTMQMKGVSSTFPSWVPPELRSRALFDKVFGNFDPTNIEYPSGSKQRALYNILLDNLDQRLGVDTSAARRSIIDSYDSSSIEQNGVSEGSSGSPSGSPAGEFNASAEADKIFGEASQKEVTHEISPEEISKIVDNSLEKRGIGVRENSVSFFKNNPADITAKPIRVREVDGKLTVEDGRHRLQAAKELGISHIPVEDVTHHYTGNNSAMLEKISPMPIEGTGSTKVRGLSAGVEQTAIEKKLTSGFGDLPEYQKMNIKDQARLAVELMKENYDRAKRIALGQESAPHNLHPEAVFTAVEARALKEGDVNTLRDLATRSSLTTEATTMGQRIKLLDERNPESPVKAIRDISKARETAARKSTKDISKDIKDTAKDIKAEIDKVKPKKQDWAEFIRSIQC